LCWSAVRLAAMQIVNGDVPAAAAAVVAERDAAAELAAHLDLIANLSLDDSSNQCIPMVVDSLKNIKIVGSSAGHRHSLLLDAHGGLYSFGAGSAGCLGHGDTASHMYPCRIQALEDDGTRIRQMSAGVDMSMAVSTAGQVFAWGRTDSGRIGLGMTKSQVALPRRVYLTDVDDDDSSPAAKAVDVECGYVHSLIVGLNGTLHQCGGVGVDGEDNGQQQDQESLAATEGRPRQIADFNIWHRTPEPKAEQVKKERWKKLDKYEVKGRSKMLNGEE
jgi:alpha-tubulin suppressor-like RCC1 family protein